MITPIYDFVQAYAKRDCARFHMPGHKGIGALGCEVYDITEIEGADVLSSAEGIIAQSEENASALFETAHSFYSTEGSSLSIKAMLALVTFGRGDEKPLILAARNVHRTFIYACALLDLEVAWLYPRAHEHLCTCTVTAQDVEDAFRSLPRKPAAVYLTSPDYLGQTADIREISEICHERGIPLLVDNAHGAYLRFLEPSRHPIALGADLCCDSAHKTLPVLTGGAYLHVSRDADAKYVANARRALATFASTSPSYLILQSLDLCNRDLANGYREKLLECVRHIDECKRSIASMGFPVEKTEPLKIVIDAKGAGYLGTELADLLRQNNVEAEFADADYLVLMVSPHTRAHDFDMLEDAFAGIPVKEPIRDTIPTVIRSDVALSIREAILAPQETVPLEQAEGRICAAPTVSCPPAVPIVISGEVIDAHAIRLLRRYGTKSIDVVAQ